MEKVLLVNTVNEIIEHLGLTGHASNYIDGKNLNLRKLVDDLPNNIAGEDVEAGLMRIIGK